MNAGCQTNPPLWQISSPWIWTFLVMFQKWTKKANKPDCSVTSVWSCLVNSVTFPTGAFVDQFRGSYQTGESVCRPQRDGCELLQREHRIRLKFCFLFFFSLNVTSGGETALASFAQCSARRKWISGAAVGHEDGSHCSRGLIWIDQTLTVQHISDERWKSG